MILRYVCALQYSIIISYRTLTHSTIKIWAAGGVHRLKDLYCRDGLLSFQQLEEGYSHPGFSWLLRTIRAHAVPWDLPLSCHPLDTRINPLKKTTGLVSSLYYNSISKRAKTLGKTTFLDQDLEYNLGHWTITFVSSKNPAHELINFIFVHKYYATPIYALQNEAYAPVDPKLFLPHTPYGEIFSRVKYLNRNNLSIKT